MSNQQLMRVMQERERAPARAEALAESVEETAQKSVQDARYYLLCDLSRTPFGRPIHAALQTGGTFSVRANCPKCPSGDIHILIRDSKISVACTTRDCMSYTEF